eukprot:scaffold65509_cov14-Prasinocladus_malaysianus.AAC.1
MLKAVCGHRVVKKIEIRMQILSSGFVPGLIGNFTRPWVLEAPPRQSMQATFDVETFGLLHFLTLNRPWQTLLSFD